MHTMRKVLALAIACVTVSGCQGLSGVGGESEYICKAPDGVTCMSMDGVYANVRAGNLPGKDTGEVTSKNKKGGTDASDWEEEDAKKKPPTIQPSGFGAPGTVAIAAPPQLATAPAAQPGAYRPISPGMMNAPTSGMPLRTPERILRLWLAAIEDADGVLHDQRYMYVPIERGRWQVETFLDAGARTYEPVTRLSPKDAEQRGGAGPTDARQAATAVARREGSGTPFQQANPTTRPAAAAKPQGNNYQEE